MRVAYGGDVLRDGMGGSISKRDRRALEVSFVLGFGRICFHLLVSRGHFGCIP